MARWRLTAPHYLNIPGSQWEQKETNRDTGRQAVKRFDVPQHLDPDQPADQNYPGEVVVCFQGKGQGRDITFIGTPTPDMEPLDDEAKAISEKESKNWIHPIESLAGQGYSDALIISFEKQMEAVIKRLEKAAPVAVSAGQVSPEAFARLQAQVEALVMRNAELEAARVDDEEPLPSPELNPTVVERRV